MKAPRRGQSIGELAEATIDGGRIVEERGEGRALHRARTAGAAPQHSRPA